MPRWLMIKPKRDIQSFHAAEELALDGLERVPGLS